VKKRELQGLVKGMAERILEELGENIRDLSDGEYIGYTGHVMGAGQVPRRIFLRGEYLAAFQKDKKLTKVADHLPTGRELPIAARQKFPEEEGCDGSEVRQHSGYHIAIQHTQR
jgi:hypothetical protein